MEPEPTPPDTAIIAGPSRDAVLAELLTLSWEFFQQASPTVRDELRGFLTNRGYHPKTCLGWYVDSLAFNSIHRRS